VTAVKPSILLFLLAASAHGDCLHHTFDAPATAFAESGVVGKADFDGDGKLDTLDNSDVIRFGGGNRTLTLPHNGTRYVEDVNGDGRPDLVGVGFRELFVLLNNGDLTFTEKITRTGFSPDPNQRYYWADYNGDGLRDVYITGLFDSLVSAVPVWMARSDGTFAPAYSADLPKGPDLLTADVNGDGRADIIVDPNQRLTIYLSQPNGSFAAPITGATISGTPVSAVDFNGDGKQDIIYQSTTGTPAVTILFDPAGTSRLSATTAGFFAMAADFNVDGMADLVADDPAAVGVRVYLNDGHGEVHQTDWLPGFNTPFGATATDVDGDGLADLPTDDGMLPGNGDGTFRVPRMDFPAANAGVAGDFDGDGDDDVALPNLVAWNDGDGTFRLAPHGDARLAHPIHAVDADGDGKADVLATITNAVVVLSPRPDGSFAELTRITARAVDAAVGDFTGTHRREIAVLPDTLHNVEIYDVQSGAFRVVLHTEGEARRIAVADLNGDGRDDIVVSGGKLKGNGFVSTFLSAGASFGEERQNALQANETYVRLVTGDFNGDGKADAAAISGGHTLIALLGDGAGNFPATRLPAFNSVESDVALQAADLDGDGRTDLSINGADIIDYGGPDGPGRIAHYVAPRSPFGGAKSYLPLVLRPARGALPWIVVPTQYADSAYVYKPKCEHGRGRVVGR
jgi:hypothetical protein